jgi:hypothetical protein
MAVCDYCGASYRGGAIKDGPYRYCMGICQERGSALLGRLDRQVPQREIEQIIAKAHSGPCEGCGKKHNVDVYSSYTIWSVLIYSQFRTNSYVLCRECASNRQLSDLSLCLGAGWWSPWGVLITPIYIALNIAAMIYRPDPTVASESFRKLIRMNLARKLNSMSRAAELRLRLDKLKER